MKQAVNVAVLLAVAVTLLLALGACQTTQPRVIIKEVARPCPVTIPERPKPLDRPLPTDAVSLAARLAERLSEWAGPGGYGERADSALKTCVEGSTK